MKKQLNKEYITVKEAAVMLGRKSVSVIRDHIHAGRLPAQQIGRDWVIRIYDIEKFKEKYPYKYRIAAKSATMDR